MALYVFLKNIWESYAGPKDADGNRVHVSQSPQLPERTRAGYVISLFRRSSEIRKRQLYLKLLRVSVLEGMLMKSTARIRVSLPVTDIGLASILECFYRLVRDSMSGGSVTCFGQATECSSVISEATETTEEWGQPSVPEQVNASIAGTISRGRTPVQGLYSSVQHGMPVPARVHQEVMIELENTITGRSYVERWGEDVIRQVSQDPTAN